MEDKGGYPNKKFRKLVVEVRDPKKKKEIYIPQENRKIDWSKYNKSKIEDVKQLINFINESVNKIKFETKKGVGKPSTNPKYLAKAILFCEAVNLPEREAQGWLELLGHNLGIHKLLDDRVIGKGYALAEVAFILNQVFENERTSDGNLGGDGTGLERSRKQNYEKTKKKQDGQYMTSIVDSREIVQAFNIAKTQECQIMHELIKKVKGKKLTLDAGFNDRELVKEIAELGMTPYVFPMKSNNINGAQAWRRMYLDFYYHTLEWLTQYHSRNHTESFHSSFKRVFGIVTKEKFVSKFSQVCARIIIHNHRRRRYFDSL